jgi:hypothetical protein
MKQIPFVVLTMIALLILQSPNAAQAEKKCPNGLSLLNASASTLSCNVWWVNETGGQGQVLNSGGSFTYDGRKAAINKVECYHFIPSSPYPSGSISIDPQYCSYKVIDDSGSWPPIKLTPQ